MDSKEKNITDLRAFFTSRFPSGTIEDSDQFGLLDDSHSFRISGDGMVCTVTITDKVLNSFGFAQIEKLCSDDDLFGKMSQHPYAHIKIQSMAPHIEIVDEEVR